VRLLTDNASEWSDVESLRSLRRHQYKSRRSVVQSTRIARRHRTLHTHVTDQHNGVVPATRLE